MGTMFTPVKPVAERREQGQLAPPEAQRRDGTPEDRAFALAAAQHNNQARQDAGLAPIPVEQAPTIMTSFDPASGVVNHGKQLGPAAQPHLADNPAHAQMSPTAANNHEFGHATANKIGSDAENRFDTDHPLGKAAARSANEAEASARGAKEPSNTNKDRADLASESAAHVDDVQRTSAQMQGEAHVPEHPGKVFLDVSSELDEENRNARLPPRERKPRPAAGRKPDPPPAPPASAAAAPATAPDGTSRY